MELDTCCRRSGRVGRIRPFEGYQLKQGMSKSSSVRLTAEIQIQGSLALASRKS